MTYNMQPRSTVSHTTKRCAVCANTGVIEIPWIALRRIQEAVLSIADAWPESTPEERELLATGRHAHCALATRREETHDLA